VSCVPGRLVDLRAFGIDDRRILRAPVRGAVVVLDRRAHVLRLDERREAVPRGRAETEPRAQCQRVGIARERIVVDVLVARAEVDERRAAAEGVGETVGRGRGVGGGDRAREREHDRNGEAAVVQVVHRNLRRRIDAPTVR
jgi:hypothetical protein